MRYVCIALAFAGALIPCAHVRASEPTVRTAQMARDVTDAVRQQRIQQGERADAPRCSITDGRKR